MQDVNFKFESTGHPGFALALGIVCLVGITARAQVAESTSKKEPTSRLLTVKEGRSIVNVALEQKQPPRGAQDCSHLTHQIYLSAGFDYPYASSFELFSGNENFVRVKFPHVGDLIVWPGHVGIVVNPSQHTFSSLGSTGLGVRDYESPYWKSRGRPRFYRYKVQNGIVVTAAKAHSLPENSSASGQQAETAAGNFILNQPSKAVSEHNTLIYGPLAPADTTEAEVVPEAPSSIIVAQGSAPPTREEIVRGVSALSDTTGNVLQSVDFSKLRLPVVIVERFRVERVEVKRDHGWAYLQIDSKVSIVNDTIQRRELQEVVRWELRRMASGWETVNPADRIYVPHDSAVRNLAAQLSQLTQSEGAVTHQEEVLRQESQIVQLLSALLERK
jgi:NlpC/P60 family